ncbi:MAG: c-type cytochrome [Candidatus Competibacteraceae bacterium]|nr:c-type cytochrome [Candidatus Competibacteraceae bacterium]
MRNTGNFYTRIAKATVLSFAFAVLLVGRLHAAGDPAKGETVYKSNCIQCHQLSDQRMVGPGLKGFRDRWTDEAKLRKWIKNSTEFLKTGDKYANDLFAEYNSIPMPAFETLSDQDMDDLLSYMDNPDAAKPVVKDDTVDTTAAKVPPVSDAPKSKGLSSGKLTMIIVGVIFLLLIAISVMRSMSRSAENKRRAKEGKEQLPARKPLSLFGEFFGWMATHKKISFTVIFILICWLSLKGFWALNDIGVYGGFKTNDGQVTGYMPDQPIEFSHKLHVGQNKIECTYCHSTAEKSRHSGIPSSNICMNCHKAVESGPKYGKQEIAKIYAAVGWNPKDKSYFSDYQNMNPDDVKKVFSDWLSDTEGAYAKVEPQIQKPVEWVQIHHLPEHAYFSHQQHVVVGKVECATCHGNIEEMDKVFQYSPLTMGWCINCHRTTEVQYADNAYYERLHNYYKEHQAEFESRGGKGFTVEKIGGLDCSKCHY